MKRRIINNKGAYLVKTALLLPVIVFFLGWIISRAMMLNFELDQQIAVDFSAISGAHYARHKAHYVGDEPLMHSHMSERSKQVLATFGHVVAAEPLITLDGGNLTLRVESTSPPRDLFLIHDTLISKHAQAQHHTDHVKTILLP